MLVRVGSRGSRLALTQAERAVSALRRPGLEFALVPITTAGDRDRSRPFGEIGSRGVFVKELEEALLDGRIDVAVHSAKDLTATDPDGLSIGAYIRRDRHRIAQDFERVFGYFPRLRERFRQQAGTLSGGEQQMLAIARALLLGPRLLLLDEPSFGLAPLIVQDIFAILHRIRADEGVSILLVEQNASLALDIAEQAYLLETGRIVVSGPAAEIRRDESIRRSYLGY